MKRMITIVSHLICWAILSACSTTINSQTFAPTTAIPLPTSAQSINKLPLTTATSPVPTEEIKATKVLKAADRANEIVERWKAKMMQGSGWLHLVFSDRSEVDQTFTLHEEWMFINDQGMIEKSINTVKDRFGNISQQAILNNGIMVNEQLGDREEGYPLSPFHLDFGFLHDLNYQDSRGNTISVQEVDYNGTPSIAFTFQINYADPKMLGNSPAPVERIIEFGSFDKTTDMLNQYIIRYKLADGREMIFEQTEIMTMEKAEPPTEIISLLEKAK